MHPAVTEHGVVNAHELPETAARGTGIPTRFRTCITYVAVDYSERMTEATVDRPFNRVADGIFVDLHTSGGGLTSLLRRCTSLLPRS